MEFPEQTLLDCYARMCLIRAFEEKLAELFSQGLLGGTSHFCIGQEACAVGVITAAREDDWLISNHRGHGHLLARGLELQKVMSELLGRSDGYCGGRGGSQHLSAPEKFFLGTNGITGGGLPIATGAALALQYRGSTQVAIVFFGDGASNQGTFHESLNMASLWKLPVLYVCENNRYGMSNPVEKACAGGRVSARAQAYCLPADTADGSDVEAVAQAASKALEQVRSGAGPFLLELLTYRHCGHSKNDPRIYRSKAEEQQMWERDCLRITRDKLLRRGIPDGRLEQLKTQAAEQVQAAAQQSLQAPFSSREETLAGVFA